MLAALINTSREPSYVEEWNVRERTGVEIGITVARQMSYIYRLVVKRSDFEQVSRAKHASLQIMGFVLQRDRM